MDWRIGHYVIIARDRPDLLERALERFGSNDRLEVIVDRRQTERRRRFVFPKVERRRAERRRVPESTEDLRVHAVAIIPKRGAAPSEPATSAPASAAAPETSRPGAVLAEADEIRGRLEQWRRDTEWVLMDVVPSLLARVELATAQAVAAAREGEQLRADNEALRRERAEMEAQLGASLARLDDILRAIRMDSAVTAGRRAADPQRARDTTPGYR